MILYLEKLESVLSLCPVSPSLIGTSLSSCCEGDCGQSIDSQVLPDTPVGLHTYA